ncbi:MAG: hypothetical protein LKM35_04225 [Lachnospiraceae bacterium]|jgi:expansin (peptidoglycan-binding protein)|nr:hypothetical protein [Lachnospiraceae bacterium]
MIIPIKKDDPCEKCLCYRCWQNKDWKCAGISGIKVTCGRCRESKQPVIECEDYQDGMWNNIDSEVDYSKFLDMDEDQKKD